jgi:flagellar basal-body rod modification protein FlgD
MADPITALDANSGVANGQSSKAKTSLAADFDAFLLLLTTQLKNQDPLSPMEPTEFTSQLVAFASVEQQINANENLEKLVGIQNATLAASIIGFVGTNVEAEGGELPLQNGEGKFSYTLDKQAKNVVITISDSDGNLVFTQAGERAPGRHEFTWDGKDADGIQQPDGAYKVTVSPIGNNDEVVTATVTVYARITGVDMANGTNLDADGVSIPLDKVLTIKDPDSD